MIDIVIPLGKGSTWQDNELRFALRSIVKHIRGFRNVYIIGELPDWITGVIHIPHPDLHHPSKNILDKIQAACRQKGLSQDFFFTNDDIFFLKNITAADLPYYHKGSLELAVDKNKNNWYQRNVVNTIQMLSGSGYDILNYDIHAPIIYNKHLFPSIMAHFNTVQPVAIKSLYKNALDAAYDLRNRTEQAEDVKIYGRAGEMEILEKIQDKAMFSTGDQCLLDWARAEAPVKTVLKRLFPDKSPYEK